MANTATHGDPIRVGAFDPEVVEDCDGVAGEALHGVGGLAGFIALAGAAVVKRDHAMANCEVVANRVPAGMVAALAADEEQGLPGAGFFVVEGDIAGGGKWHGADVSCPAAAPQPARPR